MVESILTTIKQGYVGYANYLYLEITTPGWHNYFYWLIGLSFVFWILEIVVPWRKQQAILRKDFWLDAWYMVFNFFLFSLIAYNALSDVVVLAFHNLSMAIFGTSSLIVLNIASWPLWVKFFVLFVLRDFTQWNIHRLLHAWPKLWEFHKVHHSVEQMGFAAHLRYHWMETIVYRSLEYIPLALIGFGLTDFFIVHIFTLTVGHFNHSNINVPLGPLKYVFNNPQMHIWHHVKELPNAKGVNFGLTLSVWDYIFGTSYLPKDGRDVELGFENVEQYPTTFTKQMAEPFKKR